MNQGSFLEETIISILSQEYENLEYIIIDGGSSDKSLEIIKSYESELAFWVSESDEGQSHAINKGFQKCTGDIITFCNSDDIYLPGTFKYIGRKWKEWKNKGAFIGSFQYMDHYSNLIGDPQPPYLTKNGPVDLSVGPPGNYRLHQTSTFYNRNALDDIGRYVSDHYDYIMDRELLYRVLKKWPVYLDNRNIGAFRIHEKSKSEAEALSFAREFYDLHISLMNGVQDEDKMRQAFAKYYLFRGFVKLAKRKNKIWKKFIIIYKAIFTVPEYFYGFDKIKYWFWVALKKHDQKVK